MLQAQQTSSNSSHLSPHTNPIPSIHPPGTDPDAYNNNGNPSRTSCIHSEFQPQLQHPNADDPITYAPAINSMSETPMVTTILNSLWNNGWMNQDLMNQAVKRIGQPSKGIQSIRCEVCKIDCNSKDVFEKHILGKKHRRNLQIGLTDTLPNTVGTFHNEGIRQMIPGDSGVAVGELEMEKHEMLEGGTPVNSMIHCTICNVSCNSQVVFCKHLAGRKHVAQVVRLMTGGETLIAANSNPISLAIPPVQPCDNGTLKQGPSKMQLAWCEVCKISCNSYDILSKHKFGKKHQKNLEKLNATSTPASTSACAPTTTLLIAPTKNLEATATLLSGAETLVAANSDLISSTSPPLQPCDSGTLKQGPNGSLQSTWCKVCKISCNSYDILNKHKFGKKHRKNLEKLNTTSTPASTAAPDTTLLIGPTENLEATARLLGGVETLVAANSNLTSLSSPPVHLCDNGTLKQGPIESLQSPWCEVCKISCNSYDILSKHKLGKKHLKNVEKLNTASTHASTAAPATALLIGPMENSEASKGKGVDLNKSKRKNAQSDAPVEDLDMKRQKIMERGAAAGAVKVCTVCNVVCNSPIIFNAHLAGKKHGAMVKKQAEAGVGTSGPQMVAGA